MNTTAILPDGDPASMSSKPTVRGGGAGASGEPGLGSIDQYEIIRRLGGGGFGVVYLARDAHAGVEVALKTLHPLLKHDAEEMDRLREKFRLVCGLSHPNIASPLVLHYCRDIDVRDEDARRELLLSPGDSVMVMRYAPGVTLSKWRKAFDGGVVPPAIAIEIGRQIAAALDYAHSERIVHRDVKPENIMVETLTDNAQCMVPDGAIPPGGPDHPTVGFSDHSTKIRVRILDFGLAAEIRSSMARISTERFDTSGTRPYMAPEQWLGRKQDGRTDEYALACLLYELLSGDPPFTSVFETGDPEIMMVAVERRAPDPVPGLPAAANAALLRALAKNPDARFPSCAAFVEALASALGLGTKFQVKTIGKAVSGIGSIFSRLRSAVCSKCRAVGHFVSSWRPRLLRPFRPGSALARTVVSSRAWISGLKVRAKTVFSRDAVCAKMRRFLKRRGRILVLGGAVAAVAVAACGVASHFRDRRVVLLPQGRSMVFRRCPAGSFIMGSDQHDLPEQYRQNDEQPHRVVLTKPFYIGETEVTQGQWKSFWDNIPKKWLGFFDSRTDPLGVRLPFDADDSCPIYNVTWKDANDFCDWLTERERKAGRIPEGYEYRLPTEAEWEYACRAGRKTSLPNGRDIRILGENDAPALDGIAWYGGNSSVGFSGNGVDTSNWPSKQYYGGFAGPRKVRQKKPNDWGVYDMLGNVWEWCYDRYGNNTASRVDDPVCLSQPGFGDLRVLRGGAWDSMAFECRASFRQGDYSTAQIHNLEFTIGRLPWYGFRVALAPSIEHRTK